MSTTTEQRPGGGAPGEQDDLARMSFGDHLDELRRRLIWSILAVLGGVLIVTPFKSQVTDIYVAPYHFMWDEAYADYLDYLEVRKVELEATAQGPHEIFLQRYEFNRKWGPDILAGTFPEELYAAVQVEGGFPIPRTLKALGGLEDFWVFLAATLLFGVFLALPVVLYQVWAFIAAGLYAHERRVVLKNLPFAIVLTAIGVVFGYSFVVPAGLFFLTRLMDFGDVEPLFSVAQYFSFLLTLTAVLGVVFQLPLVMLAIQKVGIASHRAMRKNWRLTVLGFFLLSALVTPPDPFTQVLMAIPMSVLYALGLFLTWRAEKAQARSAA